jgi:hypothetical protein
LTPNNWKFDAQVLKKNTGEEVDNLPYISMYDTPRNDPDIFCNANEQMVLFILTLTGLQMES